MLKKQLTNHRKAYLGLTTLLFLIEIFIALYVHDDWIRPYFGDVLVVILIYCFVQSILNASVYTVAIGVLIFSYLVEFTQYFKLIRMLGLQHSLIAKIIMGNTFAWTDMLAYTLGIGAVLFVEKIVLKKNI